MNIRIGRSRLFDGLKKVQIAANAKSVMPIYGTVRFVAKHNKVSLTTTDGEISLYTEVDCEVGEEGVAAIPVRTLVPIIAGLLEGEVTIDVNNNMAKITNGNYKAKIACMSPEEFPKLPKMETKSEYVIKANILQDLLKKTAYAQSGDDTRRALMSVLLEIKNNKMNCVATDGRRLAVASHEMNNQGEDVQVILPSRSVSVIQRFLIGDNDVRIRIVGSQILLANADGSSRMYSRLVDGTYPNYMQVVPKNDMPTAVVDRDGLISTLERVATLDLSGVNSVKMTFSTGVLKIEIKSDELGDATDELPIKYDGNVVEILFNPKYVVDPLKAASSDDIEFALISGTNPAIIRSTSEDFFCVLMPMRVH